MKARNRFPALLWFLGWCAFFSLAFTSAYWIADALLLATLVTTMIVFNAAKVQKLWKYRSDPQMRDAHISAGKGGIFDHERWLRFVYDSDDKKDIRDSR